MVKIHYGDWTRWPLPVSANQQTSQGHSDLGYEKLKQTNFHSLPPWQLCQGDTVSCCHISHYWPAERHQQQLTKYFNRLINYCHSKAVTWQVAIGSMAARFVTCRNHYWTDSFTYWLLLSSLVPFVPKLLLFSIKLKQRKKPHKI